jgi:diacylglycerol diphosphate phosphatase/phosphatidate phosphatase
MEYTKPARIKKLYSVLALVPMAVAGIVAASRVVDNKHHPADVVGGAVLGTSVAWFVHGLWYVDIG